ncbi:MAG: outer membrane protein assembly factor BamA, partial [Porphyromonadaceae bacterium]|nr:outer membrane protein assembly factor BamA [Porphyromonadaceae bacterium]
MMKNYLRTLFSGKLLGLTALFLCLSLPLPVRAQEATEAPADTLFTPVIDYGAAPHKYVIAGISVSGATDNYEDFVIIGYSGLSVGDEIEIPGEEITNAIKRFWKQGLFSDVAISISKVVGDQVWLNIALQQRPRISEINYNGIKKSEREDLEQRLGLIKGNQITPNLVDRAKYLIKHYYDEKGFKNAEVVVYQKDDLSHENQVIVDINVDKKAKVKVHKITFTGNEVLHDRKLHRTMKKTAQRKYFATLFRSKKYIPEKYAADLERIIDKYNEKGYRDAVILSDSVVPHNEKTVDIYINLEEGDRYYIRNISWVGNTVYSSDQLDRVLRMKPGDVYNQKLLNERTVSDDDAVSNIYMDNGYLFFQLHPIENNVVNDSIDLELSIMEGPQATINKVSITGNDRLYEHVVRRELRTLPGELFNRSELMRSMREIMQMGHFNPETMDIRPEPDYENGTVDLTYVLESKANDQIELSAGWGQTGIIGRLSLKFTNFSIRNLFNPKTYKGIIPQGDGETLTLSVQTNARYYQSYSMSYYQPWFGGKRPNSFSFSLYYSKSTALSTSFYNDNYYSYYDYYYGYTSSSTDYSYAIDPDKYIKLFGVSVGIGQRLTWPDDYFTFSAELGYQLYLLKNWEYLFRMQNGTSHAITLALTLARSSIDNPLYTTKGSEFALSLQLTPPYSLFDHINYDELDLSNAEDQQKLYRWIEYHKWKFNSKFYLPLASIGFSEDKIYTLVLMGRFDLGILGAYNKNKKSPFETFYVGGDGMTGSSYNYATETIALRGYENGALTPYGQEGYAYARLGAELHFPVLMQGSTVIYALTFAEAGNAWTEVKNINPFKLKRSAGVGIRIYLPMIGLMGIDWGYGFDKATS